VRRRSASTASRQPVQRRTARPRKIHLPRTRARPRGWLDLVVETLEAVIEERGENEPIWVP